MANVALYYPWIYLKSGVERTILEITRRSRHDVSVYTSHYDRAGTYSDFSEVEVSEVGRVSTRRTYVEAAKAAVRIAGLRWSPDQHDALVVCCDGLGPLVGFRNRDCALMNLCFTPLRAVYDEEYRRRLLDGGSLRRSKVVAEYLFRFVDRQAWRHFDSVICNSTTTRDRVVHGRLRRPEDVIVAYPGIAETSIRARGEIGAYFFLPGRIMWTKNIELAIDAYRHYKSEGGTLGLVIAGMVDRKSAGYFADLQARAEGLEGIRFESEVSDPRMTELYEGCRAVLLSAFNEDQGLTPLEGMTCGKPAVAVNRGGPRKSIVSGVTGFLVEPEPEDFSAAMLRLEREPGLAERMGAAGLERVRLFTWERFIGVFDDEIDRITSLRRRSSPVPERVLQADPT